MKQDKHILTITRLLEDLFEIVAVYQRGTHLEFALAYRFRQDISSTLISDRLRLAGYDFSLDQKEEHLLLRIDPRPKLRIPPLNIVLFVATLFTVYFVPVFLFQLGAKMTELAQSRNLLPDAMESFWEEISFTFSAAGPALRSTLEALGNGVGIEFTIAMISILFVHEMGHFLASRRRNIVTSWPYFIPAPNIIGTFGAIIKSKSPFWNRRDLIEVGATGPIAGWVVAALWLWYGLSHSSIVAIESMKPWELAFSLNYESIMMKLSTLSIIGPAAEGHVYKLTEAAFAGWVGLLVTAINLLPIGQLDGGHIVYGLTRRYQYVLSFFAILALLYLGFQWMPWWLFAGLGIAFGTKHPPTLNDQKKPGGIAAGLGIVALIILVLSFTPIPFQ